MLKYVKNLIKNNKEKNKTTKIKLTNTEITIEPEDNIITHKNFLILYEDKKSEPHCIINTQHIIYMI